MAKSKIGLIQTKWFLVVLKGIEGSFVAFRKNLMEFQNTMIFLRALSIFLLMINALKIS